MRRLGRYCPRQWQPCPLLRKSSSAPAWNSPTVTFPALGGLPGAGWSSTIDDVAPCKDEPILVTCANGVDSILAGSTLAGMGYSHVSVLEGGMNAWRSRGLEVERGLSGVMTPPNDVVVMGPHRSYADTIHYLRWEEELGHKYTPKA